MQFYSIPSHLIPFILSKSKNPIIVGYIFSSVCLWNIRWDLVSSTYPAQRVRPELCRLEWSITLPLSDNTLMWNHRKNWKNMKTTIEGTFKTVFLNTIVKITDYRWSLGRFHMVSESFDSTRLRPPKERRSPQTPSIACNLDKASKPEDASRVEGERACFKLFGKYLSQICRHLFQEVLDATVNEDIHKWYGTLTVAKEAQEWHWDRFLKQGI